MSVDPQSPPSAISLAAASTATSPTLHNFVNNLYTMSGGRTPEEADPEEVGLFLSENGHLSFENPNYQMMLIDPSRLDDHLNSNVTPAIPLSIMEEIRNELEQRNIPPQETQTESRPPRAKSSTRRAYAAMDSTAMGVDVSTGPTTELDNKLAEEKLRGSVEKLDQLIRQSTAELTEKVAIDDEIESAKLVESDTEKADKECSESEKQSLLSSVLPSGWERHEDDEGPYFWHVRSGTIQRHAPANADEAEARSLDQDLFCVQNGPSRSAFLPKSCTSGSISELGFRSALSSTGSSASTSSTSSAWKRRSMPPQSSADAASAADSNTTMKLMVRSLGWVELREDELTAENSSKSVNRCIVQLSSKAAASSSSASTTSTSDPVGQWGGGKELVMELDEGALRLLQPDTQQVLHSQPIHSIRVWGVGRDGNGGDFAYVARDRASRKHVCHVFRCEDTSARAVANTLRDICKKLLIERSLGHSSSRLMSSGSASASSSSSSASRSTPLTSGRRDRLRPTNLGSNVTSGKLQSRASASASATSSELFPTPMEEPRKILKALFVGTLQVTKPGGIDVIHGAIDQLVDSVPRADWRPVAVAVAPSTISITYSDDPDRSQDVDCRVRFLSFLGIGVNPQQCAFIMHTTQDTFVAHVFHCEPSAGPLCKTIEAACKLRYQKCLDARPMAAAGAGAAAGARDSASAAGRAAAIGATLKSMLPWGRAKTTMAQTS